MARSKIDVGGEPWGHAEAIARDGSFPRSLDASLLPWLVPFAIAAGYLVVFAAQLPHNLAALAWNPSVGSAYVMPETLVETGTGGHTVMGSSPQWASLWFGLLTAKLPLHRELWSVAPTLLFFITALIVGWSVQQLAGRRAAILAVLLGVVASPIALTFFMAPFSHNTVYPCTALVGAYLIWLTREEGRRRLTTFAVPPILGVVVGACLASDLLLAITTVVPLALTALFAAAQRDRRSRLLAVSALTTVAVSIPVEKITAAIMKAEGFLLLPSPIHTATLAELPARAELLFKGLKQLFNGYLGTEAPGPMHAALGIASDVVMSAALLALIVVGLWTAGTFVWSGLRRALSRPPGELARSLHIIYWVSSPACAAGAFWIAGEGPTTTHESYYATALFAVGAVIPLLMARRSATRWLIALGASVFFVASLVGLTSDYVNVTKTTASSGENIIRIAAANHVQVGYTNFGDASGVTWASHNRVLLRPVEDCENPEGTNLCPGFQAYVPAWYVPQRRHTFLVVDANGIEVRALPAGLGKPLAAYRFEAMTMYIYPYDIATRFGRVF